MNPRLARLACVVVLGVILTFAALQLPVSAQDQLPPTLPPLKELTPTPSPKQPSATRSKISAPEVSGVPNLDNSKYIASGTHPGETITYTMVISNGGTGPATATILRATLATNVTYVSGSAQASAGTVTVAGLSLRWTGSVNSNSGVTITYRVILPNTIGTFVQTVAQISDPGLIAAVTLNLSLTTQAATGGPDALGYTYRDSFAPGGPTFTWIPTTALSTKLVFINSNDDDFTGTIPIGFPFKFYTGTYTSTYVGTNGMLSFGAGSSDNTPTPIPTAGDLDNYIGCFWADLYIQNATQGVWVETFGSAPNRYTVFTYRAQYFPTSFLPDPPGLWQVILYETSNKIKCQYQETTPSIFGSGSLSSIGLENFNGTIGLRYFFDGDFNQHSNGPLEDNLAIEFTPGTTSYPAYVTSKLSPSYNVHPGDVATYSLVVSNTGTANGTATTVNDPIPAGTTYVPGSAQVQGGGTVTGDAVHVAWSGGIPIGQAITITFRVQLTTVLNTVITNTATISDPQATFPVVIEDHSLKVQPNPIGGPDHFSYTYKDSFAPGGPTFNWIPTTTNSITVDFGVLPADDVYHGPITIGFPLNFYTGVYTDFFVSTNGLVSFGAGSDHNINSPIPTAGDGAANYASCFWSDLYIKDATQGVWVERFGSAPNRHTVITFRTAYFVDENAPPNLFQMILSETSNTIKCQYKEMPGPIWASGGGSTIGLENADETDGLQYYYGSLYTPTVGPLESNLAILFTPVNLNVPAFAGSSKVTSAAVHPSQLLSYTLRIFNNGRTASTISTLGDPTPAGVTYVNGSAQVQGGGLLNANAAGVNWSGTVVNSQRVTITYDTILHASSGFITNTFTISDPSAVKPGVISVKSPVQPTRGMGVGPDPRYLYADSYSNNADAAFNWVPTTTASNKLTLLPDNDDGYNLVPISFTFRFDGRNYVKVFVSSNGLVMFNDNIGSTASENQPIPTLGIVDSYATCFWDDQAAADATQGIWVETFGSAPQRYTVITFVLSDTTSAPTTAPYQYQMILYERSNRIKCQYNDMTGSINGDGRHATIGLENKWGDGGVQYFYGSDNYPYYGPIENGLAILFEPEKSVYLPIVSK